MLTAIDSISLAGDRAKQNDDACGASGARAWVIDGATDLHDAPLSGAASDAAWLAHRLNADLFAADINPCTEDTSRAVLRGASQDAGAAFKRFTQTRTPDPWTSPLASVLMIAETEDGLSGIDLGDCRAFALDADGAAQSRGGPDGASDREAQFAARMAKQASDPPAGGALYRTPAALEALRKVRVQQIEAASPNVFGLNPACADNARAWTIKLSRPAHILLCTDGLSALVDRYAVHDAASLVRAALDKGLHALCQELRAIETQDASGAQHPRFKRSDDATGILLRLT